MNLLCFALLIASFITIASTLSFAAQPENDDSVMLIPMSKLTRSHSDGKGELSEKTPRRRRNKPFSSNSYSSNSPASSPRTAQASPTPGDLGSKKYKALFSKIAISILRNDLDSALTHRLIFLKKNKQAIQHQLRLSRNSLQKGDRGGYAVARQERLLLIEEKKSGGHETVSKLLSQLDEFRDRKHQLNQTTPPDQSDEQAEILAGYKESMLEAQEYVQERAIKVLCLEFSANSYNLICKLIKLIGNGFTTFPQYPVLSCACQSDILAKQKENQQAIIEELIASGADINLPDECGITPIMATLCCGDAALAQLLLNHTPQLTEHTASTECTCDYMDDKCTCIGQYNGLKALSIAHKSSNSAIKRLIPQLENLIFDELSLKRQPLPQVAEITSVT